MDVAMNEEGSNVVYLSSLLNNGEENHGSSMHKCGYKCYTELVWGNIYRCKLTGITHICDKNCDQRIVYDNYHSVCRVSRQMFPLSDAEMQAVRGVVRRRADTNDCTEGCASKRRRDPIAHPSPFERSIYNSAPICSQVGDSMDTN